MATMHGRRRLASASTLILPALILSGCFGTPEPPFAQDAATPSPQATAGPDDTAAPTPTRSPEVALEEPDTEGDGSAPDTGVSPWWPRLDDGGTRDSGREGARGSEPSPGGSGNDDAVPDGFVPDDAVPDDVVPDDADDEVSVDGSTFPAPRLAELRGIEYPDVGLTLTDAQLAGDEEIPPLVPSDAFTCEDTNPSCGPTSLPAWTADTGFAAHGVTGQVQLADLDGDGSPEAIGVGAKYAEIWTYDPDMEVFVPFQDGRGAAFTGIFGRDVKLDDQKTYDGWLRERESDRGVASMRVGDFDGDGREEIAARTPGDRATVGLFDWDPDREAFTLRTTSTSASWDDSEMIAADVTDDGRDDYVIVGPVGGRSTVVSWNAGGEATSVDASSPRTTGIHGPLAGSSFVGAPDRLVASAYDRLTSFAFTGTSWSEHLLTGIGSISSKHVELDQVRDLRAVDVDGDGHDEYVVHLRQENSPTPLSEESTYVVVRTGASGTEEHWEIDTAAATIASGKVIDPTPHGHQDGMIFADLDSNGVTELVIPAFGEAASTIAPSVSSLDIRATVSSPSQLSNYDIGDGFSSSAWWGMAGGWTDSRTGEGVLVAPHATGLRTLRLDGRGIVKRRAAYPEFLGEEALAYRAISSAVTLGGSHNLRRSLLDTLGADKRSTTLASLTYAGLPASDRADFSPAAFERVRAQLEREFDMVHSVAQYFHARKNVYMSAYAKEIDLAQPLINEIKLNQREQYEAHNDVVDMIEEAMSAVGSVVDVATFGAGHFAGEAVKEITHVMEFGELVLDASEESMHAAAEVSGMEFTLAAPLDSVRAHVPNERYEVAAAEVPQHLVDAMSGAEDTFQRSLSQAIGDYGLLQAIDRNLTTTFWTMTPLQESTLSATIQHDLELFTYATVIPAVAHAYSCVHETLAPACVAGEAPANEPAAAWISWHVVSVHLAWQANVESAAGRNATNWGWSVGDEINKKLFGDKTSAAPTGDCRTSWVTSCSFNLPLDTVFNGSALPVNCYGLRPNAFPDPTWGYRMRGGETCFSR